jgi:hypothetical protein
MKSQFQIKLEDLERRAKLLGDEGLEKYKDALGYLLDAPLMAEQIIFELEKEIIALEDK